MVKLSEAHLFVKRDVTPRKKNSIMAKVKVEYISLTYETIISSFPVHLKIVHAGRISYI